MKRVFVVTWLLMGGSCVAFSQKPDSSFSPSGKLWGLAFGDFAYKLHADALNRGTVQYSNIAQDYNAFDFRRIFLGYDYQMYNKFSAQVILSHEGGKNLDGDGNRTILVKTAFLKWKNIYKNADLFIGLSPTPSFDNMDQLWSYRSIEKTVLDMRSLAKSNDFGIALRGRFNDKGILGYTLMVANGTGLKPENDTYKKLYSEIYGKFLKNKLFVSLHLDYEGGKSGDLSKNKSTFKIDLAYQSKPITIGLEVFQQIAQNGLSYKTSSNATLINANDQYVGASVFVRGIIVKDKLSFFSRYDFINPDTNFTNNYTYSGTYSTNNEEFLTAGLDFTPAKNIHFMPNIWMNTYESKVSSIKTDHDLTGRATFYYIFGK